MFAPDSYTVRKFTLKDIIAHNFNMNFTDKNEEKKYYILQQDNMLFRQIRLITNTPPTVKYNPYILFVDCNGWKTREEQLDIIITNGFIVSGKNFVVSERSSSMNRNSILSFIDADICKQLNTVISMDVNLRETVLSKWYSYRGLMLSSCHCIDNWLPKIIVVSDYLRTIPSQTVRHLFDDEVDFIDKNGNKRKWKQKNITQSTLDIDINAFDGCGIHHPLITEAVMDKIGCDTAPTSIQWRLPFCKGMTHEIDYESFFEERGIEFITDIWGQRHSIYEPMIIIGESMYKGYKYFKTYGDYRDWDLYWKKFRKYNHCIGVAKWNSGKEQEPVYTRANYQILQDLDLEYEEFAQLAFNTIEWIEKIIDGEPVYTYCFLGIFADNISPINDYYKAILKNPEMLKESGIRYYLINLVKNYINETKCGKIYLKSCFKTAVPDLIMFLEHIGGLETSGCLEYNEFYSNDLHGDIIGKRAIERNPHICKSEHVILEGVSNELTQKYLSHLNNIIMLNCKSLTPQRLNGCDYDGDLLLLIDDETIMKGIDASLPAVIDTEDKITAESEEDNEENKLKIIKRSMVNMIGEYSNMSTCYHNKTPKTIEQKKKYMSYVDIVSVITGKSIDYAKTGILYRIPQHISKYAKPLPYFMKYVGRSYEKQKLSYTHNNMNKLCREIEKWEKLVRFKKLGKFDYTIMLDSDVEIDESIFSAIEQVYLEYCKEMKDLYQDQWKIQNFDKYKDEYEGLISRKDSYDFVINWNYYFNQYKEKCKEICPNEKMLANIAVMLCYEKYKSRKNKNFVWKVSTEGILKNLNQIDEITLPIECNKGSFEYLGKFYKLEKIKIEQSNAK